MKLSVIIVTYNSSKYIKKCLNSLMDNLPGDSEVIVVDNGSKDDTRKIVKDFGNVKLVESENVGFGKGVNLGIKNSIGEYLFLLNPDTVLTKNSIKDILEFANNKKFGIIVPQLIESTGITQESVTNFPTIWNAIKEFYLGIKSSYSQYAPKNEGVVEVECVYGAAMLINKSIFVKVGGFDERYFMYFEDLDLCRKIKKLGLKIYYLPFVKVYHEVGGSIENNSISQKWLNDSAKIYHGLFYYYLLYLILWLRPKKN